MVFVTIKRKNRHLGVKLRLIKSNSCNSRLELTGTRFNDGPLHKCCSHNRSISHLESEDTVRNIIHRIETNAIQEKRIPRIIESKCIEKAASDAAKAKPTPFRKEDLIGLSKSAERLGPIEILSQVSVKNHINANALKSAADEHQQQLHNHHCNNEKFQKSDVVLSRNKNVDLALQMNKSAAAKAYKEKINGKTSTATTAAAKMVATKKDLIPSTDKGNGKPAIAKTAPITATVRPTSLLTKAELDEKKLKENHKAILQDLCKAVAKSEEEKNKKSHLTKWDTVENFYEKNYFANDAALKRKPKYDDIEFEEFEVIEQKKQ